MTSVPDPDHPAPADAPGGDATRTPNTAAPHTGPAAPIVPPASGAATVAGIPGDSSAPGHSGAQGDSAAHPPAASAAAAPWSHTGTGGPVAAAGVAPPGGPATPSSAGGQGDSAAIGYAGPGGPGGIGGGAETWERLDRRMLLVHPVTELIRFIPVLLASLIAGARADSPVWSLVVVGAIVVVAVTRWFTTTYRITPDNVELRTGLIQRKRLSVPRNRVRSVDVEADLLHRALGLAVLSIGTGQQAERGDQFKLDSLDAKLVPHLRTELLAHTRGGAEAPAPEQVSGGEPGTAVTLPGAETPAPPTREPVEIAHWRREWVRYAPLSLTGFAIIAPIVGLAFQYGIAGVIFDSDAVRGVENGGVQIIALAVAALIVALVLIVSLAACARYLATYHDLRVVDDGATLHIRHGLFTTRQITLDLARLRGATVNEPLLLRWAGAAELEAIMTGADPRQKLLPQAPREAVDHTLAHLLDDTARVDAGDPAKHTATTNAAAPAAAAPAGSDTAATDVTLGASDTSGLGTPPGSTTASGIDDAPGIDTSPGSATDRNRAGVIAGAGADSATFPAQACAAELGPGELAAPAPVAVELTPHGPAAHRRRYTRALSPVGTVAGVLLVLSLAGVHIPAWIWALNLLAVPIAIALAWDRYRGLGHAVVPAAHGKPTWLITRSGSLDRDRDCLEAPGVIGWTVRQSWFQRRVGLATVTAASAAGKKRYHIIDIPLAEAWPLIEAVTPGQLGSR
ncbi:PH domain-containing protein [Nocardia sp. NPDC055321]